MNLTSLEDKEDLKKRLRRIAGQVRGVEKMVEADRDCRELLQQLAAIRSAVHQVSLGVARSYACQCLEEKDEARSPQEIVEELLGVLSRTA